MKVLFLEGTTYIDENRKAQKFEKGGVYFVDEEVGKALGSSVEILEEEAPRDKNIKKAKNTALKQKEVKTK